MNKYQEGKIYKIVCNVSGEEYYGSTIEKLYKRLSKHKNEKRCLSRNIINRGDYKIELIKDYPCNNVWELEEEEAKYIRNNKCINKQIPHRTYQERYEDNKEDQSQKRKIYYKDNKKEMDISMKKYREENKEEISKKRSEKLICECGELVSKRNIARHKKTIKHIKLTECIIID